MNYLVLTSTQNTSEFQSGLTKLFEAIANLGIMVVVSGVAVYFLIKVLNSLLSQSKMMSDSILPKMNEFESMITVMKTAISDQISSHNAAANKQLASMEIEINSMKEELSKLEHDVRLDRGFQNKILIQLEKIEGMLYVTQNELGINTSYAKSNKSGKNKNSESDEVECDHK